MIVAGETMLENPGKAVDDRFRVAAIDRIEQGADFGFHNCVVDHHDSIQLLN